MYNPLSTYRIQFNKDFTFRDLEKQLNYFSLLGIGTIYASPVFAAAPGSMHGYDIIDPHFFNHELGTRNDFNRISDRLRAMNIGWLQDIVPNHMAFHHDNHILMDVLEYGKSSDYASYFDIDFEHIDLRDKVMIPILGSTLEEAVDTGQLKIKLKGDKIVFEYFDHILPVNRDSLISILHSDNNPHVHNLGKQFEKNHGNPSEIVDALSSDINKIKELLSVQHYKLTRWQETSRHINFRRFFTINNLISLQMERDQVFEDYHRLIIEQVQNGKFQGLRVDHIDGLNDPSAYLEKLRCSSGDDTYIIAEKILAENENLPVFWPVQGSTGYDFLSLVNGLLSYSKNYPALKEYYNKLSPQNSETEDLIYNSKKLILFNEMKGDLDNLSQLFFGLAYKDKTDKDLLKEAIAEFLIVCPKYRLYSNFFPLSEEDSSTLGELISIAKKRNPGLIKYLDLLHVIFLSERGDIIKSEALSFFRRLMQYTGPLMAKGIEDTAMYRCNWSIIHNEVGDAIDSHGLTVKQFHDAMTQRQALMPMSLNTTSTHDTKRGEDVRARLAVLSELADEWIVKVDHWMNVNRASKIKMGNNEIPDVNEEYFIYQTLIGVMPFDNRLDEPFLKRIDQYLVKALREAKIHSNWVEPDSEYENAVCSFVRNILNEETDFRINFCQFQKKISRFGIINSLSQIVLKTTCPGIPDFYQGTEFWDLSLVDPDNRRSVDYRKSGKLLRELIRVERSHRMEFLRKLFGDRASGNIKLFYSHLLIKERALNPSFFIRAQYCPLVVSGKNSENVLAYGRNYHNEWYVVIIPLYLSQITENEISGKINWGDTKVLLPELAPESWISVIDGRIFRTGRDLFLSELLEMPLPCIIKGAHEESSRKAGILLHITSLPGNYGVGDMGSAAYRFIDILKDAGQSYWQLLPLNPVIEESAFSPYSTSSAFAGNIILIDPEWLLKNRLITEESLRNKKFENSRIAEFQEAFEFRRTLLEEAYSTFISEPMPYLKLRFSQFCNKEKYWIDDYALFMVLKTEFRNKPWFKWPEKLRDRDVSELERLTYNFSTEIGKVKFMQFIFSLQWEKLKEYSRNKGISIIGDLSFYVSYDSADVWQHPDVFKLDSNKKMIGIGGAPPDYFSETGQFWKMPVYNWSAMKGNGYSWWLNRIKRNMEWFDLVRFDHFRGFSGFWEIPGNEKTAVNGRWVAGPGDDFFSRVSEDFPEMPFIAEDLGEIDDAVYKLRDSFKLPGMKVLQFAFTGVKEKSIHLPHNFVRNCIVYTGTHDNNTTKGWYEKEISNEVRRRIGQYTGKKLSKEIVQSEFIRLAYASVAKLAIVPLQDIIGIGEEGRLNNPSGDQLNWNWKLQSLDQVTGVTERLRDLAILYWRI